MGNQVKEFNIAFLGATGVVGTACLKQLLEMPSVKKVSTFGRRPVENVDQQIIQQHKIDIGEPSGYEGLVSGHNIAICTLGVGQPTKVSKEHFIKIDKIAVLDFAKVCKAEGVEHFELLASVGIDAKSSVSYLKTKGELVEELKALNFKRLSVFQPSMIITPTNRYGFLQGLTLKVWPFIDYLLIGGLKKYRGIKVAELGGAIALNLEIEKTGTEHLEWGEMKFLYA